MGSTETAIAVLPGHACQLFRADDIFVSSGANLHDGLAEPDQVCLGDSYQLDPAASPLRLLMVPGAGAGLRVAEGSDVGRPGDTVRLACRYRLMTSDGDSVELLLVRVEGAAGGLYVLPMSPLGARIEYMLLKIEDAPQNVALADLLCVSFAHGTMISMADGSQRPIESLRAGDRVLTRDHGPQPIRWIGNATLRAVGAFAPVVITQGTLGNIGDLVVSQHHRIFLYYRQRNGDLPTSEVLVQARHLVNGDNVYLREGGFIDFFSLVFDRHEIVYAEGIPAESLMVNEATVARLPAELAEEVRTRFPGLSQRQHVGTEASRQLIDRIGPPGAGRTAAR
ncbi:Hint domain-containing protein [Cereibacter sphaeroides]|uniref:Hint domain-containing protein n=1 Tax=Cereibacter sphaeroides TaxID=1063 RepID=UPI001F161F65|nr:Hint domain-containing protein [Cereibacter sphaeroides]MCE6969298.1 Hint domain-containing protein [Cereibacter sphaeroides]